MSLDLVSEIWNLVKDSIPYDDKEQVAEGIVGVLLDHGYDLDDIRREFVNDGDFIEATKYYADESSEYDLNDYRDYDDDDLDEDW